MEELFDMKATNGECIAKLVSTARLRLFCIEELGDEYVKSKSFASVWIPVNTKGFWSVIKAICDNNVKLEGTEDNASSEFKVLSKVIENLMKQLED